MRFTQICLITIVWVLTNRGAVADTRANCDTIAVNFANTNVKDVNLWLSRYRGTLATCLANHEDADDFEKPSNEIAATKSANPKAVFKSEKGRPNQKPLHVSKIMSQLPAPKHELRKRVGPKNPKKIGSVQAKTVSKLPVPASTSNQEQKTSSGRSVGAESWRINCSARFGGWDKSSEWYISTAGKRVSCGSPP